MNLLSCWTPIWLSWSVEYAVLHSLTASPCLQLTPACRTAHWHTSGLWDRPPFPFLKSPKEPSTPQLGWTGLGCFQFVLCRH